MAVMMCRRLKVEVAVMEIPDVVGGGWRRSGCTKMKLNVRVCDWCRGEFEETQGWGGRLKIKNG